MGRCTGPARHTHQACLVAVPHRLAEHVQRAGRGAVGGWSVGRYQASPNPSDELPQRHRAGRVVAGPRPHGLAQQVECGEGA